MPVDAPHPEPQLISHLLLHDDVGGQPVSAMTRRGTHHGVGVVTQVAFRHVVLLLHLGAGQHQRRGAVRLRTHSIIPVEIVTGAN